MPCSDSGGMGAMQRNFDDQNNRNNNNNNDNIREINSLRNENYSLKSNNNILEASFCAICTELEKRNILNEVILTAEKAGEIKLTELWINHKIDDESRLTKDLSKYSEHELEMIKKLLK